MAVADQTRDSRAKVFASSFKKKRFPAFLLGHAAQTFKA
jgi:hypothetical protein